MNRSTFLTIKYMNGSFFFKGQVYEWGRFRNAGSHTRTTITLPRPPKVKAIKRLSSGKAKGSDAIPAEIYKGGGPPVAEKLTEYTLKHNA